MAVFVHMRERLDSDAESGEYEMVTLNKFLVVCAIGCFACPAYAYVGPGLGAGVIASILGVLGAGALAVFSLVYYPFKRLIRKRQLAKELEAESRNSLASPAEGK